ncbi:MAG: hypothetical protein JJT96_19800 [Opitutales bacterium]|nr:hypothetical protein [Opitutales bacterium]
MKKRYKIPLYALGLCAISGIVVVGTLIYPGWNLSPFLGFGEAAAERALPGLSLEIDRAHVQLRGGREGVFTVGGIAVAEKGGEVNLKLEAAGLHWPLGRVLRMRLMPERVDVTGCRVWISTDEQGFPQPPQWLPMVPERSDTPETPMAVWADLRLSSIPLIWKLDKDEHVYLRLVDYVAYLRQPTGNAAFSLPLLEVTMEGWENGVHAKWAAGGNAIHQPRWVEGQLTADVPGELISWKNNLFLPLTPDLAEWLGAGFPFLPIPSFFETQATFASSGTTDLRAAQTTAEGTLSLAPGTFALPGQADLHLSIPRVSMSFESRLSYGAESPLLHSDLRLRIGEGERAAEITVRAEVDGGADQISMQTTGALRYLEDLIGLLPPAWQPVAIQGDFSWETSMDTLYTAPAKVRRGRVSLGSAGIAVVFPGDTQPTIDLASFAFSGQMEQAGQSLLIEPFHLAAGPVRIDGTGLNWDGSRAEEWGTGHLALAPLAMADLLDLIPAALLTIPTAAEAWLRDTRIETLRLEFGFLPDASGRLNDLRFRLQPEWSFIVAGMPIQGSGIVEGFPFLRTADADITLARFNPAHLQHPLLEPLGILDGDFAFSLKGNFDAGERIVRITSDLAAESAKFQPGKALDPYLVDAIPVHALSIHGHLSLDSAFASRARFLVSTGLGDFQVELAPESFSITPTFPETIHTDIRLALVPAPTAQILTYLAPTLIHATGLTPAEISDFDLRQIDLTLSGPLSSSGETPYPPAWCGSGSLKARTGSEPFTIDFSFQESATETLHVSWKSEVWDPGQTDLAIAHRFGLTSETLHLPLMLSGGFDFGFGAAGQDNRLPQSGQGTLQIQSRSGSIYLEEVLARRLALDAMDFSVHFDPLIARIDQADLRLDTPLGQLTTSLEGLDLLPTPLGIAHLRLERVDLAKVFDYLAPGLLLQAGLAPDNLSVSGTVSELTSRFQIGQTPPEHPLPFINEGRFQLRAQSIMLQSNDFPGLSLPRVTLGGTLDHTIVFGKRKELISLDADMDDFFFPDFQVSLRGRFTSGFSGEHAGCEDLRIDFRGMEGSDLQMDVQTPTTEAEWNVRLTSRSINLAPLLLLLEGSVADLFRDSPESPDQPSGKHPRNEPAPRVKTSAESPPVLPEIRLEVALDRLHLAREREIGALRSSIHVVDGSLRQLAFALTEGEDRITLTMEPDKTGWSTTFFLGKVHHWIATAVAPLHLYQSAIFRTNETIIRLRNLPDSFDQGDLRFYGHIAIQPELTASLHDISLAGLILRTEVTFLSRIAALVDRRVMLLVPFKEFRVSSLTYDANRLLTANNIFVDGPINLALDLARFDTQSFDTLIQGRVFGIAFEVVGTAPDLSFYLQEKPVIRAITVQDDFDW